jgi:hypothetical protein
MKLSSRQSTPWTTAFLQSAWILRSDAGRLRERFAGDD